MATFALDTYWEWIQADFGSREEAGIAYAIMMRESHGDPNATNDTRGRTDLPHGVSPEWSIGLFQINLLAHLDTTLQAMLNPGQNIAYAAKLYKQAGWAPWTGGGTIRLPDPIYGPADSSQSRPPAPLGLLLVAAVLVFWLARR